MREAFLRTIIENPADDGPRLVFADWLEEQGETERAEFIRVQIQLHNWPCHAFMYGCHELGHERCECGTREQESLRQREHELIWLPHHLDAKAIAGRRHTAGGIKEAFPGFRFFGWDSASGLGSNVVCYTHVPVGEIINDRIDAAFCRGFVESIACSWETWDGFRCERCHGEKGHESNHGRVWNACRACNGTGHIPGLSDAILAVTPLRKVKLKSAPPRRPLSENASPWEILDRMVPRTREWMKGVLRQHWPKLEFDLTEVLL